MTQDQSAWTPEDPTEEIAQARRRGAAEDAGPPRFVDRFASEPDERGEPAAGAQQHPDDDVDPTTRRAPSASANPGGPVVGGDLPAVDGVAAPAAEDSASTGLRPRNGRKSFLSADTTVVPAESGLRGFLARLGFRIPPSTAELAVRADVAAVSRHWPVPAPSPS